MQSRRQAREAIIGLIYELSFHDATEKPEDILADARAARGIPEDEYVDACFLGIADRLPELPFVNGILNTVAKENGCEA